MRRKGGCEDRGIDRRLILALLTAPAAGLVVLAATQARQQPELTTAGGSSAALALELTAGLALTGAALSTARRGELALAGALIVAATGLALGMLPEPPDRAVVFTLALVGAGVPAAAAAHAALLHPGGRSAGSLDRVAIVAGYVVTVGLLGLARALVLDPRQSGCFDCPGNLLLVHGSPGASDWLDRWMPGVAAATEVALAVLVVVRLLRRPPAARASAAPVSAAAVAALAFDAMANARDGPDQLLWLGTCAALAALAAGFAWRPLRARRARAVLTRIAVAAPAGADEVTAALSHALRDPDVSLLLPHPETREPISPDGTPAPRDVPPGRARTAVERRAEIVAWVEHRAHLRATPDLLASTVGAAGLMLERESLRAAQRLQAEELRESSLRLVSAGEAERRRLERDLHDGAQQRLLALGLGLARARSAADGPLAETLTQAEARVGAIRDDLRKIAHGIHSVTLAEGGLAEAVLALVQAAGGGIQVDALPERRFPAAAEAAVYRLVVASLALERAGGVRIAIESRRGELDAVIRVSGVTPTALAEAVAHAGARVFAVGGSLAVASVADGASVRASVPGS